MWVEKTSQQTGLRTSRDHSSAYTLNFAQKPILDFKPADLLADEFVI